MAAARCWDPPARPGSRPPPLGRWRRPRGPSRGAPEAWGRVEAPGVRTADGPDRSRGAAGRAGGRRGRRADAEGVRAGRPGFSGGRESRPRPSASPFPLLPPPPSSLRGAVTTALVLQSLLAAWCLGWAPEVAREKTWALCEGTCGQSGVWHRAVRLRSLFKQKHSCT